MGRFNFIELTPWIIVEEGDYLINGAEMQEGIEGVATYITLFSKIIQISIKVRITRRNKLISPSEWRRQHAGEMKTRQWWIWQHKNREKFSAWQNYLKQSKKTNDYVWKKVFAIHIRVRRLGSIWENDLANAKEKWYNQKEMSKGI